MSYFAEIRKLVGTRPLLLPSTVVLLFNPDNHLLMQYRSDNKTWGVPGGFLEMGETPEQGARRELMEETGLKVGDLKLFEVYGGERQFLVYPNGDEVYCVTTTYLAVESWQKVTVFDEETVALKYIDLTQLPSPLHPPVQELFEDLEQRKEHLFSLLNQMREQIY